MNPSPTTIRTATDCDVLIVGAGPTGLTLAAQLLSKGVSTRVIDRDPGTPRLSRAIGIQARTMETLDLMGILDRFLDVGHRVRGVAVYRSGRELLHIDMRHNGSTHRFQLHLPQSRTEALLRERVRELGGDVESGIELVAFADDSRRITASLRDTGGRAHTVRAAYLVGCDGAHSTVRHLLGVPFAGHPYPFDWLLADTQADWDGPPDRVHIFATAAGQPLFCVPITPDLWRISLPMPGTRDGGPPELDEIQSVVDERSPHRIAVHDPETLTSFRCQLRSSTTYRTGRVLLAGDAVHIHSPAGGQGMNTGMQDATNLAWKLALVVAGHAHDGLLDTYGRERGPVARQVLAFTERIVRFDVAARSPKRVLRDAVLPTLRLAPAQRRLAGRMAQTSVSYSTGPLTRPGRVRGLPRPGERMPDLTVDSAHGQTTLYAVLRSGRHVVISGSAPDPTFDTATYDGHVDVVTASLPKGASALVRPDGHLAAVGTAFDTSEIHDYLRSILTTACVREPQPGRV